MLNFNYSIPTKVFFGKGQISKLGENLKPLSDRVLLVYGGGSVKKNGLYEACVSQMKAQGIEWFELSGVDPNPRITSVREGIKIVRENGIGAVLGIGGGSAIDCSKVIAAGACYDGDPWDLVINRSLIVKTLPVACVPTLAATGTEMDAFAVISNMETRQKIGGGSELHKPIFAIMDPEYTYSVPAYHTAAGTADIMSHTFENYFNNNDAYFQETLCQGILRTCIKYGPIAMKEPDNYEARANLMWASSHAINGTVAYGEGAAWSVHPMEHELSAYYDITHGVGLAILTPRWMEYVLNEKTVYKFAEYGKHVWGLTKGSDMDIAKESIKKTYEFFESMGIPMNLSKLGIDGRYFEEMASHVEKPLQKGFVPLSKADIVNIYKASV